MVSPSVRQGRQESDPQAAIWNRVVYQLSLRPYEDGTDGAGGSQPASEFSDETALRA